MRNWKYKVKSSQKEIINRLKAAFGHGHMFVFNTNDDYSSFKLHKPVKYPDQILHRNRTVVYGRVSNTNTENETDVEVSFSQDFYMKMTVFSVVVFCFTLIALILKNSSGVMMYLFLAIVVIVGILLGKALQVKLEKDSQKYKSLLSDVLKD